MRLIDADELMNRLHERLLAHNIKCDSDRCARAVIISCMEAVDRSLTISYHTNQPLTLEELQEMDGEPVWFESVADVCDYECGWAIVNTEYGWIAGNSTCSRFEDFGHAWIAYRRKP